MKFDQLVSELLESTSPLRTLYHTMYLVDIEELVKTNTFKCSVDDLNVNFKGSQPEIFKKYLFFMSTARIPNNAYNRYISRNELSKVTLVLDALKLSDHGYPIKPINFYGVSNSQESEDRILSKNEVIKNFNQYIKEFHVYITESDIRDASMNQRNIDEFNDWIDTMLSTGKPCYKYKTIKDFLSLNRARREPLSEKTLLHK